MEHLRMTVCMTSIQHELMVHFWKVVCESFTWHGLMVYLQMAVRKSFIQHGLSSTFTYGRLKIIPNCAEVYTDCELDSQREESGWYCIDWSIEFWHYRWYCTSMDAKLLSSFHNPLAHQWALVMIPSWASNGYSLVMYKTKWCVSASLCCVR